MSNAGIVRNRLKIDATITNAAALLRLQDDRGPDALTELIWSFAPERTSQQEVVRPQTRADIPAVTSESTALSKALKKNGFVFVGPTTMYAAMQAVGLVDDHLPGCHRAS